MVWRFPGNQPLWAVIGLYESCFLCSLPDIREILMPAWLSVLNAGGRTPGLTILRPAGKLKEEKKMKSFCDSMIC